MNRRGRKTLGEQSEMIGFKVPRNVKAAIDAGARAYFESPAAYVRRAVVWQLRADGLLPPIAAALDAAATPTTTKGETGQ